MSKTYSPEFKLQVVLEAPSSDRSDVEIARANEVHPAGALELEEATQGERREGFGGDNRLKEKKWS